MSLCKGIYGEPLLEKDQVLMEVKVGKAFPKWMVDFLTENKLYKTSFSKYANAYRRMYEKNPDLLGINEKEKVNNKEKLKEGLINYA